MKQSILILMFTFTLSNCLTEMDTEWWQHTIIYEILTYSFKDSDNDGVGDLKGITSKLDHFVDLNIETLHLTPMYQSTFLDMGYDVTDYYKIYPKFGTMDDFDELVKELNKRDMKLILDLVINHSGHEHEWFKNSINKIDPYTNFYVWKDAKGFDENTKQPIPPNRWHSVFGGSAWKWHEKRQQFYLHQFMEEQVDFNLNNEILKQELKKIIKFWLDKGVSGFRLDAVIFFMEDKYFRDDDNQLRQYNQEETYEFVHELRVFLDEYNIEHGGFERVFLAEAHSDDYYVLKYYGSKDYPMTHLPYAFQLEYIYGEVNASQFNSLIEPWLDSLPEYAVSAWMIQDHDGMRVGSRIRPEYSDMLTMASMMLPGTVGCYYGQEIAMVSGDSINEHQKKDISGGGSRDPHRLIMQWQNDAYGGFTTHDPPYLPAHVDFPFRNVQLQKEQKISHYHMFKDLSTLRRTDVFKYGNFDSYVFQEFVYVFTRSYQKTRLVVVINFHESSLSISLKETLPELLQSAIVAVASVNAKYQKGYKPESDFWNEFSMNSWSSIVLDLQFQNKLPLSQRKRKLHDTNLHRSDSVYANKKYL